MPEDYQQTVDLREQMEKRRQPQKKAAAPIDKIYEDEEPDRMKKALQKISQPKVSRPNDGLIRLIVFVLAILTVLATVYFLFFRAKTAGQEPSARDWYAVKLVNGEIFYGQIADIKGDPVVIANVYYNYDQAKLSDPVKDKAKAIEETGNIRLVKRGKETHGPDGSMNVVRAQVLYMEALKADSKVLQAILQYEK
ncbi:MAG: hypothetical protein Q7K35_06175 [bacterium]|nr:hypothetical protein [bacterium]